MSQPTQSPQERFRSGLEDLLTITTKLAPHVAATADLVSMIELALINDGQLSVLMALVTDQKPKGRIA